MRCSIEAANKTLRRLEQFAKARVKSDITIHDAEIFNHILEHSRRNGFRVVLARIGFDVRVEKLEDSRGVKFQVLRLSSGGEYRGLIEFYIYA